MIRVLLVEDDDNYRYLIKKMLNEAEPDTYEIIEAADGLEALVLLKNQEFDLMITDLSMPNMNGVQLIVQSRIPDF